MTSLATRAIMLVVVVAIVYVINVVDAVCWVKEAIAIVLQYRMSKMPALK